MIEAVDNLRSKSWIGQWLPARKMIGFLGPVAVEPAAACLPSVEHIAIPAMPERILNAIQSSQKLIQRGACHG